MRMLLPIRDRRGQTGVAAQGSHHHQHREAGHALAVPRIVAQQPGIVHPRVCLRHNATSTSNPVGFSSGGSRAGALRAPTDRPPARRLLHCLLAAQRAVLVLPDVACLSGLWCFSFDYHHKRPRTHCMYQVTCAQHKVSFSAYWWTAGHGGVCDDALRPYIYSISCEPVGTKEAHNPASITASATCGHSAGHRSPRTPPTSGAGVPWPRPEAPGVADALIEGRLPRGDT